MAGNPKQKPAIPFRALEKVRVRPNSLVQICLKRVAANYLTYEGLEKKLGRRQLEDIYAMLDLRMSLPEAATRISDESYWKRRAQANHRNAQVEKHGMSWKQTFLELDLQQALERLPITFDGVSPELEELRQQVHASRLHIYQLNIGQFPSHTDLSFLFDALPALCSFSITFGNRRLGMDYERAMFGMKISDAQYVARNIRVSQTLVALALPCNMIDDELVKVLMGGLSYGHMLTHLDLSHNKIGDRGARRIASLLDPDYCIHTLDLSDNQIHANGCMHLGAHLAENTTCSVLSLRLNRCEDNGVSHMFQDICVNKCLRTLNLSCNDLTMRCLPYMSSMIAQNTALMELDISANPLYQGEEGDGAGGAGAATVSGLDLTQQPPGSGGGAPGADCTLATLAPGSDAGAGAVALESGTDAAVDGGLGATGAATSGQFAQFARCLVNSTTILRVDVRRCGLPQELAERITNLVKHRELRAKGIPVDAYERSKIAPKEEVGEGEEMEDAAENEGDGADAQGGEEKEGADGEGAEGDDEKQEEAKEEEEEN